ncbi:MAG: hypothetical protein ACOCXV_02755 [Bacteroidota bacterium]
MRTITLFFALFAFNAAFAQTVENANVYPSNLEENMYFNSFNPSTNTIEGLYFLVLSDGDNSRHVTPAFEVSIYLMPEGSSSREDLIIVKKYPLDGIYHMGSHEFNNESINLNETPGIQPGNYRVGIWVNSDEAFDEDRSDNATLFSTPIRITSATAGSNADEPDDTWDDWDDEEW